MYPPPLPLAPTIQSQIAQKKPQKQSQTFRQLCRQNLQKQPPLYLLSSIKDKTISLDLDLVQVDDLPMLAILFTLPVFRIGLYAHQVKKDREGGGNGQGQVEGQGQNGAVPIYASGRFKEVLKGVARAVGGGVLRSLGFERVPLLVKHMLMLKQCLATTQNLKQLSFRCCNLTDDHLQTLKPSLTKSQSLVILDLSHNKLTNSGITLQKILSQHSTRRDELIWFASLRGEQLDDDLSKKGLCQINLQGNQLNDRAVGELVAFLRNDQWIRCVNLRGNRVGGDGVREFARLVKKNSSLISLDLRGNPGLTKQYSVYILKKLKQNIEKYKQQKKQYIKKDGQQLVLPKQNKNNQHKSLQQSRHKLHPKGQHTQDFTLHLNANNNMTAVQKRQLKGEQILEQNGGCQRCKYQLVQILKLQKNSLDLQLQLKKLKHVLLTKNIDISAILPQTFPPTSDPTLPPLYPPSIPSVTPQVPPSLQQFLAPCQTDEDLLSRVEQIMLELTRIMENIDGQQNTQIVNVSNNFSRGHSLSNTVPIFVQSSELGEFWEESSGGHLQEVRDRDEGRIQETKPEKIENCIENQREGSEQKVDQGSWMFAKDSSREKSRKVQKIRSQKQLN